MAAGREEGRSSPHTLLSVLLAQAPYPAVQGVEGTVGAVSCSSPCLVQWDKPRSPGDKSHEDLSITLFYSTVSRLETFK